MLKRYTVFILLTTACLLSACGGGSSQSDAGSNQPTTPVTPDPVTPDPVTPDPVTPDPVTPDPVTPDPVTPDPVTPDPVTPPTPTDKNTLLMGHSFFKPAADRFKGFVANAGISDHQQQLVFSGGSAGAPIRLWNDASKRTQIQAVLNEGDINLVGMTYHDNHPEADGYINWVSYALQKNANTAFFIALPWIAQPSSVTGAQHATAWQNEHDNVIHPIIDTLRSTFPSAVFYCIPYGKTANQLQSLFEAGNLPDVNSLTGSKATAIYTDSQGHAGNILEIAGGLVWLNAIYQVDLSTFDNGAGYQTNLNTMAADIMAAHDTAYNAP